MNLGLNLQNKNLTSAADNGIVSPTIVDRMKKANWRKISKMIQLARDEHEINSNTVALESQTLVSPIGAKHFLSRIEEDIGLKKSKFAIKPHFMKQNFRPETLKKYRDNGGVPPSK